MNSLTKAQQRALMASLNQGRVAKRSQSGRQLSYMEAWDIKTALIRVFGFGGFDAEVIQSSLLRMEKDVPAFTGGRDNRTRKKDADGNPDFNWNVVAQATVRLHIHQLNATYTETAIAGQTGPDVGEVADFAIKTAESDALKRAAIYLGTQFGLSLYDNGSLADVVRIVLAPGQEWAQGGPVDSDDADTTVAEEQVMAEADIPVVTAEQRAENEALLARAVSMKKEREAEPEGRSR